MPHLTLVDTVSGKTHRVDGPEALAGRDPACRVIVDGDGAKTVSGRHARFYLDDNRWFVEDAGSRNGTWIAARRLEAGERHPLAVGDTIGLGLTGTQLAVHEAVARPLAATMLESAPAHTPAFGTGTAPLRSAAIGPAAAEPPHDEVRIVLGNVASGEKLTARHRSVTLGRALECVIRVDGESANSVSRIHAEITIVNGKVSVRDGGSRHGTYVNSKRIDVAIPLERGDVITLGPGGPSFTVDELATARSEAPSAAGQHSSDAASSGSGGLPGSGNALAENPTPALGQPAFVAAPARPGSQGHVARPAGMKSEGTGRGKTSRTSARSSRKQGRVRVVAWAAAAVILVVALVLVAALT